MSELLLVAGVGVTLFVGYNVGGSTTGPAFGPAVGAGVLSKVAAAGLMAVCFFVGAWTIGPQVVETLGQDMLHDADRVFTLQRGAIVLLFVGGALFAGNYVGVPASTSMTAVGAIAALGVATGSLNRAVMAEILAWWIVAPVIGFWVSGVIGRYGYRRLDRILTLDQSEGPLVELDRSGPLPRPVRGPNTSNEELVGSAAVVAIGCLMAFSSGTSNVANAIAPLYGAGALDMTTLIVLACAAVAVGAFTIARRTLDTLGNDITDLPLTAAVVVATVSSALVTALSWLQIPASFVVIATMSIVGLGWGRATRTGTQSAGRSDQRSSAGAAGTATDVTGTATDTTGATTDATSAATDVSGTATDATSATTDAVGALNAADRDEAAPAIRDGEPEEPADVPATADLFDPSTTGRVLLMQNLVPVLSTVGAYLAFTLLFLVTS